MTALVQHELGPLTIDDRHALPERSDGTRLELLEGYRLATPPPTGQHQWAEKRTLEGARRTGGPTTPAGGTPAEFRDATATTTDPWQFHNILVH